MSFSKHTVKGIPFQKISVAIILQKEEWLQSTAFVVKYSKIYSITYLLSNKNLRIYKINSVFLYPAIISHYFTYTPLPAAHFLESSIYHLSIHQVKVMQLCHFPLFQGLQIFYQACRSLNHSKHKDRDHNDQNLP